MNLRVATQAEMQTHQARPTCTVVQVNLRSSGEDHNDEIQNTAGTSIRKGVWSMPGARENAFQKEVHICTKNQHWWSWVRSPRHEGVN